VVRKKIFKIQTKQSLHFAGCSEHATKSAGQGASVGAVSGAVGGLVSALVFGGNPGEAAAKGMVYGGAVGATTGAISGSQVDSKIKKEQEAKAEKIRMKIGDDAFKGLSALVTCDHDNSLQFAAKAQQQANPNFSVSGYWLEVLTYADQDNTVKTTELIPIVVEKDWETTDESAARAQLLQLQDKLMAIREEYKLPRQCV